MRENERTDPALLAAKEREYAKLLVEVGLNLQPGQPLVISCPVDAAPFARLCAAAAYAAGCARVEMEWRDDALTRLRYLHADDPVFDVCPMWRRAFRLDNLHDGAAFLSIHADDPAALAGVDAARIARANRAAGEALREFREATAGNRVQWCVASVPTPAWAAVVFPNASAEEGVARLYERIFEAVRVRGDGNAPAAWRAHLDRLARVRDRLNALSLRALRYRNALGTDLTVELPEGHFFVGGAERTTGGVPFVANMPTEELFTAPKRDGVNGRAVGSLPLVLDGNVVRGFALTFENGRIVRVEAEEGQALLERAIALDDGAAYLGEAALVPFDSPIAQMGTLFYNTLFDENAACHFAFGDAYPCIAGGDAMDAAQRLEHGLNASVTHVDFMIGTADLSVTGILPDGGETIILRDGVFAL